MECIFCQIVAGKISSDIIYQDDEVVAFPDINPAAPTHLLIVSRKHILSVAHLSKEELPLIGHMVGVANQLAKEKGVSEKGYRLVTNSGEDSGQLVPHLHIHLLGGRRLSDEMG